MNWENTPNIEKFMRQCVADFLLYLSDGPKLNPHQLADHMLGKMRDNLIEHNICTLEEANEAYYNAVNRRIA